MKYLGYVAILSIAAVCHAATRQAEGPESCGPLLIDEPPTRFADAEEASIEWTKYFITESCRPPDAARYIALPRAGEGSCDLVRSRYSANGLVVTITQSLGMFCVQVKSTSGQPKTETLADVQEIARSLLKNGSTIRLAAPASAQELGNAQAEATPELPWIKTMRWKKADDGLAFWMLKDDGHPRMADVGVTLSTNEYWYSTPDKR